MSIIIKYEPLEDGSRWESLVFEAINGKQLPFFNNPLDQNLFAKYKSDSGDNHPLCYCSQCEENIRNLLVDLHFSHAFPLDRWDSFFLFVKKLILEKVGVTTHFIFILKGK